ncbi:MAG: hypothetical protein KIS72_04140 [Luteimonas sp.]|nr:hypothetical protein [Luteimonas sp.]
MGSITSWIRLEPRGRDPDMTEAVRARVYDPLWMLARQWQTAEFQGEDGGTPVLARWRGDSTPITRYHAGAIAPDTQVDASRYDARRMPLEALVERQPFAHRGKAGSLRLAVESGLHFLRLLDAQPTSRSYRKTFISRFALQPPSDAERAGVDGETLSYWNLMATRAPDARRFLAAFRDAHGQRLPLPSNLGIVAGDRAEVERAIDDWLVEHDALVAQPQAGAPEAWNAERLEYAFSIAGAFGNEETPLTATEYAQGHLDWHSVDVDLEISLGAMRDNAATTLVRAVMPAPVSFRGAPAQRFWEFEDAAIDYGLLPAGPGDLPHLMLSEFATGFGNEWYVIPIELGIGTLTRTRSLVVTDCFGVQVVLAPVNAPGRPATGWSMFELSHIQRGTASGPPLRPASNLLFLAPSLLRTLDSRPLEEILFMRDEMANMAWAVEHVVPGPLEQRIEPAAAPDPPQASLPVPNAVPRYRLATDVPSNWIPLLPQRAADGSLRLVRGAMLTPDEALAMRQARGPLLNAAPALALFDEEIPREGVSVTRQFERTRWLGGGTMLWIGLRKRVGRGEGASALRFDSADE